MPEPPPEHRSETTERARGGPARQGELSGPDGIAYLAELEPELRGAVIFGPEGSLIECSVPVASGFVEAAANLLEELEELSDEPLDSCHIASDNAEVFVVREAGFTLVAVAARFVLASLMTYDIRMTLRDLARGAPHA